MQNKNHLFILYPEPESAMGIMSAICIIWGLLNELRNPNSPLQLHFGESHSPTTEHRVHREALLKPCYGSAESEAGVTLLISRSKSTMKLLMAIMEGPYG